MILYALILGVAMIYLYGREGTFVTLTGMTYGLLALIYGLGHLYCYNVQDFDQTAQTITISLCWMWIMLMVGNELCRLAFPKAVVRQRVLLASWNTTPMQAGEHAHWLWRIILLASVGLLTIAFFAFGKIGILAQYATLRTAEDIREFRLGLTAQGGYLFQVFTWTVAPFLAVVSLLIARRRKTMYDRAIACALIVLVLLFKLSTYHKTQWVWVLISLAIGWYLVRRNKLPLGILLVSGILIFLAFLLGAVLAFPELDFAQISTFVLYRTFENTNEVLYKTYYVYPHYLDHTHGLNIGLVHSIYGHGELISAYTQVARFFGSYGTTYNAMFLGDAWVDFGNAGIIAVSLFIGFLVKSVDLYIASMGKTPLAIAMTASMFYGALSLCAVSAFTSMVTGGILLLPLFVAGVDAVGKRLGGPLLRDRPYKLAQSS